MSIVRRALLATAAVPCLWPSPAPAAVIHVDIDAAPGGDGTSWVAAFDDLHAALAVAEVGDEIWVAEGEYRPDGPGGDPDASFVLRVPGLAVYGGFDGTETERGLRDPAANTTFLIGDLNDDDDVAIGNDAENARHIVTVLAAGACDLPGEGCVDALTVEQCTIAGGTFTGVATRCDEPGAHATRIDGFRIARGRANLDADPARRSGAGIDGRGAPLVVAQCSFVENVAETRGGGIHVAGSDGNAVIDCDFDGNSAGAGGAIAVVGPGSTTIETTSYFQNAADLGGCVHVTGGAEVEFIDGDATMNLASAIVIDGGGGAGALRVRDSTFLFNFGGSEPSGGVIGFDGNAVEVVGCSFQTHGGLTVSGDGPLLVRDCLFEGNGGACGAITSSGDARISHCVFLDNHGTERGGAIHADGGTMLVSNCLLAGNAAARGGGIAVSGDAVMTVTGCTIVQNYATDDGGDTGGGGIIVTDDAQLELSDSILWSNDTFHPGPIEGRQLLVVDRGTAAPRHSCVQGLSAFAGDGNIGADPQFVDPDGPDRDPWDAVDNDYRLWKSSPCIDAGFNWAVARDLDDLDGDGDTSELVPYDLDGAPRIADDPSTADTGCGAPALVDMGAFEALGTPVDIVVGDIDGDGVVAVGDLVQLILDWGPCGDCCASDVDANDVIDVGDLVAVVLAWGAG